MRDEITVREWQEQFKAGAFDAKDFATQCKAGWYDWFCRNEALAGRLKKIGRVAMGITDPFILDNYYVWFKNNCPGVGPLYDDARFEPISGERDGKHFVISKDSPHENAKWTLHTERFGYDVPEFECDNLREMVRYVNNLGHELEQGIVPDVVLEYRAVREYLQKYHGDLRQGQMSRESKNSYGYRYRGHINGEDVICESSVIVVKDPKDAPPDFDAGKAMEIKGFFVYSPQEAGKPLPEHTLHKSKNREQTR